MPSGPFSTHYTYHCNFESNGSQRQSLKEKGWKIGLLVYAHRPSIHQSNKKQISFLLIPIIQHLSFKVETPKSLHYRVPILENNCNYGRSMNRWVRLHGSDHKFQLAHNLTCHLYHLTNLRIENIGWTPDKHQSGCIQFRVEHAMISPQYL